MTQDSSRRRFFRPAPTLATPRRPFSLGSPQLLPRLSLLLATGALSCSGVPGGPNGGPSGAGGTGSGSTSNGAQNGAGGGSGSVTGTGSTGQGAAQSGGSGPGGGAPVDCSTAQRPPTPLRRLTRFEYNNTVRDLLGTRLTPADEFPQDEVADGFSNNALVLTVSALHAERYTLASEALAAEAVQNLPALLPCDPATTGEEACAQQFASSFGRRAFRRPLEAEETAMLMAAYAIGESFEGGIEIMIRAALQSPDFLFRIEFTGSQTPGAGMVRLNGYETAARLSYLIWSSTPDDHLLDLAEAGGLDAPEQVAAEAKRMLTEEKATAAVTEFYRQWMALPRLDVISKNVDAFPLWSDAMRAAMKDEANAVVESVVFGDTPTLEQLLTAPLALPTGPLAELYGVPEGQTVVTLPQGQRSGVLTLPGFLSVQAHPDQTSPVLRGKFIQTRLLCTDVPPPPDNVNATPPAVTASSTARARFSAHAEGSCAACHQLMDPLGFPFENYDALGVYRTTDNGQALDLTGKFVFTDDIDGDFDGVEQMATILAGSSQVRNCVATQWFKYAMGRGTESADVCSIEPLQQAFAASGTNLSQLVVDLTQTEAFLNRRATTEEVSP